MRRFDIVVRRSGAATGGAGRREALIVMTVRETASARTAENMVFIGIFVRSDETKGGGRVSSDFARRNEKVKDEAQR